jgi:hypothetical protein
MSESVNEILNYIGIINGLQTWEVINADTGEVIGYNQTAVESNE